MNTCLSLYQFKNHSYYRERTHKNILWRKYFFLHLNMRLEDRNCISKTFKGH